MPDWEIFWKKSFPMTQHKEKERNRLFLPGKKYECNLERLEPSPRLNSSSQLSRIQSLSTTGASTHVGRQEHDRCQDHRRERRISWNNTVRDTGKFYALTANCALPKKDVFLLLLYWLQQKGLLDKVLDLWRLYLRRQKPLFSIQIRLLKPHCARKLRKQYTQKHSKSTHPWLH